MRTALFLGAGASAFAGQPTTKTIMDHVRERVRERGNMSRRDKDRQNYIMSIVDDPTYTDVEKLYSGIKKMIDVINDPNCRPIIDRMAIKNNLSHKQMNAELTHLRNDIRALLRKSFEIKPGVRKSIKQMYDMIWEVMKENGTDEFQVFTTNYDTVMEEYCIEAKLDMVNGFRPHHHLSRIWADEWATGGAHSLHLTKLHGSMNWYEDADGKIVEIGSAGQRNTDSDVIIAPTEGAKDYDRDPFSDLIDHFEEEIEYVDVLLVIGFSYRDTEIAEIIMDRVEEGMALISVSRDAVDDIYPVSHGGVKIEESNGQQIKVVDSRIILYKQKFGPATISDVRSSLKAAYGFIRRNVIGTHSKEDNDANL